MENNNDFSWDVGKVKNGNTLGKIVAIPTLDDFEPETFESLNQNKNIDDRSDIVVDEFKEKVAEVLSRELHKKQ